jgi:hypothetical protein
LYAAVFRFTHEHVRIDTDRPPNSDEFSGVKPTLPSFKFRNKGLPLSDKPAQINLCKTSISPRRDEKIDHIVVKVAVK